MIPAFARNRAKGSELSYAAWEGYLALIAVNNT
jgi:hypothetical protein